MALDKVTYAAVKKYVDKSIAGGGISAGKNCTIDNISPITGGNRVTFKWTLDDGTVQTQYMDVMDGDKGETGDAGLGIKAVNINAQNHLIITFDDDTTYDAGELPGGSGEVISVNGKKGVVTLDANDVGALPDDTELFSGDYNDLDNLPDLTNFITNTVDNLVNYYKKAETYTKTEVDGIVETIKNGRFEVVFTLPTTDIKTNVIYLVPKPTTQTSNIKDEYINLDGTSAGWEKIGDTEIDLSGYVTTTALNTALADYTTTTDLTTLLAGKVDKVTGKGLSTNDYTNTDKELVDAIPNLAPISLLKDTVGWTGKNLLKNEASTQTANGITWAVNDDGTVLINGTNTDNSYLVVNNNDINIDVDTEYILSGNTTENADEWYLSLFLQVGYEGMTDYKYIFNNHPTGVKFKLRDLIGESNLTSLRCYMRVGFSHGAQTVNNVTFYPMIRKASITDDTYEPYHESVEEEIEQIYADNGVLGAKNLLPYPYKDNARTHNGITYVYNPDNTVTANGKATSTSWCTLTEDFSFLELGKKYRLSGCPTGGSSSSYLMQLMYNDGTEKSYKDYGDGIEFVKTNNLVRIQVIINNDYTANNLVFKPMITLASDPLSDYEHYVPYAMTNRELTESKALSFTLSTENATLLRNDSKIKGYIVSVRVQLQVTSEIASGTELLRKDGTPHIGFGVAVLGDTNTGNMYETFIVSSSSNLVFTAKNTIPTGYYALNYTYIQ